MIRSFHDMRRHEEGQALVLASISMLILTLCVLATINLTYAVEQKVELQNAADAAAYTTAAYEARTLNFLAYTNRAMIVQYASQMNIMALLSYFDFSLAVATLLKNALAAIPILNIIGIVLYAVYIVLTLALFAVAVILVPIIDGLNYGMSLSQMAIVNGAQDKIVNGPVSEVQRYNPDYSVTNLSQQMLNVDDTLRWGPTGTMVAVNGSLDSTLPTTGQGGFERLMMVEMVNAARHSFTAYGGPNGGSILSWLVPPKFPRQAQIPPFGFNLGPFGLHFIIGKQARTEWGALAPGGRNPGGAIGGFIGDILNGVIGGNPFTPTEELYSLDRFTFKIKFSFASYYVYVGFNLDAVAYADRGTLFDSLGGQKSHFTLSGPDTTPPHLPGGIAGYLLAGLVSLLRGITDPITRAINQNAATPVDFLGYIPIFHLGMVPYARFRPSPTAVGAPTANQLFNQPAVLTMVTVPASAIAAKGQPFIGHSSSGWGFKIGAISSGGAPSDQAYMGGRNTGVGHQASKEGFVDSLKINPGADNALALPMPGSMAGGGMAAISAAMAYYHRPGDWREPPNLFNPQWGAKLMPIADYPQIQAASNALGPYFTENLIVH